MQVYLSPRNRFEVRQLSQKQFSLIRILFLAMAVIIHRGRKALGRACICLTMFKYRTIHLVKKSRS